ncbi:hypothetical protein M9Y10_015042 [Tritrichomonas musculus]|uniref:Uncharacterized protein n=1 Tax=Tritrichomonas musculus TaxID=1915356 RepID=A0ABR2L1Y7_9EUKA
MEDAAPLVPVPPSSTSGTGPTNDLNQSLDDNYYESYSDSYDSENAIPIEPRPPTTSSHRPMRAHCAPAPPPPRQNDSNPRNYRFKPRPNPFRTKNKNEDDSILSKAQLKNFINLAFRQKQINLHSIEEYEYLKAEISRKRTRLAASHDYEEADKYQKALEFVMKCEIHLQQHEALAILSQEVKEKEDNFKSSLEKFDNETKEQLKQLQDEIQEQRITMESRHQKEINDFEVRWNGQEKNRLYNRPSNVLSTLRRQLNFMLTQCRFEEAQEVQKQIDEREKFEKEENYLQMQHDFNEALKKLTNKQNSEKRFFEERSKLRLVTFEQKRQRKRIGYENREKKIKSQKNTASNPEKAWHATQYRRLEEGAILKKVPPSQAAVTRIARRDIFEKEVITLALPPLSVNPSRQRKIPKIKKTMKASKTTKEKEKEKEKF